MASLLFQAGAKKGGRANLKKKSSLIEVDYLVQSEADNFIHDIFSSQMEPKLHMSLDVQREIQSFQTYVAALAAHDLEHSTSPYLSAALDLLQSGAVLDVDDNALLQDIVLPYRDLQAFFSPAQVHIHNEVIQEPISWGTLGNWQAFPDFAFAANTSPPTIHLALPLRGGGKRLCKKTAPNDPDEPGNSTSLASTSAPLKKKPAVHVASAAAAGRRSKRTVVFNKYNFQDHLKKLTKWLRDYPGQWPKQNSPCPLEKSHAKWLHNQRQRIIANLVPTVHVSKLTSLPGWPPIRTRIDQWQVSFEHLQKWRSEHNHQDPKQHAKDLHERRLAQFINNERKNMPKGCWRKLVNKPWVLFRIGAGKVMSGKVSLKICRNGAQTTTTKIQSKKPRICKSVA